ncbi:MAG TPA: anti-sigma factor [Longimicrobiales bacterium]|nr:anti-sigma factor [Longimicrobiales bacterium]
MDKWTEQLSDYIDGELSFAETEALEAHLLECVDCGRTLQELRTVVARASQVMDRPPENDLWQGIAARIAQPATEGSDVAPLHSRRRIAFSIPQLAAASVALMLLSGSTMYLMAKGGGESAGPAQQQVATAAKPEIVPSTATDPVPNPGRAVTTRQAVQQPVQQVNSPAAANYSLAINELETALHGGRTKLDTATVRVLESNLRTIDGAINEARMALGRDPGNTYLNRYLDQTVQKKIQLLRRATNMLRAQT